MERLAPGWLGSVKEVFQRRRCAHRIDQRTDNVSIRGGCAESTCPWATSVIIFPLVECDCVYSQLSYKVPGDSGRRHFINNNDRFRIYRLVQSYILYIYSLCGVLNCLPAPKSFALLLIYRWERIPLLKIKRASRQNWKYKVFPLKQQHVTAIKTHSVQGLNFTNSIRVRCEDGSRVL